MKKAAIVMAISAQVPAPLKYITIKISDSAAALAFNT